MSEAQLSDSPGIEGVVSRRFLSPTGQLAVLAIASVLSVGVSSSAHASLNPQSVPSSVVWFTTSALTPNGEIVVAGAMYDPDQLRPIVARFRPDGSLDPSFGQAGYTVLDRTESPNPPNAVAVGPSGEILLAGPGLRLVRLTAGGELDRSFGADGVATPQVGGSLAVDSAGRALMAGSTGNTLAVERFTTGGLPDQSFDGDGLAVASPVPASSLQGLYSFQRGKALAVRPDDRPLVVGEALLDSGDTEVLAAQFNPDGTPDASFNGDGVSRIPLASPFGSSGGSSGSSSYYAVQAMALDQAGTAAVRLAPETAFPEAPAFCRRGSALRIDPDGALDPGFGIAAQVCRVPRRPRSAEHRGTVHRRP